MSRRMVNSLLVMTVARTGVDCVVFARACGVVDDVSEQEMRDAMILILF